MKILFITSVYAPNEIGGAERSVRVLAESLVRNGHEAVVVSLAPDGRASQGNINGVVTYYVPLANIYWYFGGKEHPAWKRALWHLVDAYNAVMAIRVGKILDIEKPNVVDTNNLLGFSVSMWRVARHRKIPVVQTLRDYYLGCPGSSMFKRGANCATQCTACRFYSIPRRLLSDIPQAVIGISRYVLQKVESCGLFARVPHKFIMPSTHNIDCTPAPRRDKSPGERIVVGYLGRIQNVKGVEVLLDAVARLPAGKVTVLLGGDGAPDYIEQLKARHEQSNAESDVQFLGFVKPADLFARIDLLVVPSLWHEPLGRAIFEAYAYGVPAAVSRIGGMPEIVAEDRTGFTFPANDAAALAALLERQIDEGWKGERFFQACIEKSREFRMTPDHFERYLHIWTTAIESQLGT